MESPRKESEHSECNKKLAVKDKEISKLKKIINDLQSKTEIIHEKYDNRDIDELDSEADLVSSFATKQGFKRTNPQSPSMVSSKCAKCGILFNDNDGLKIHMVTKHLQHISCETCNKKFSDKRELSSHIKKDHPTSAQLNCNDCHFQASTGPELKKHLNTKNTHHPQEL